MSESFKVGDLVLLKSDAIRSENHVHLFGNCIRNVIEVNGDQLTLLGTTDSGDFALVRCPAASLVKYEPVPTMAVPKE